MDASKSRILPWLLLIAAVFIVGGILCTFSALAGTGALLWNIQRRSEAQDKSLTTSELRTLTRSADPGEAHIQFTEGIVEVMDSNGEWSPATEDQLLSSGTSIRTGALSGAAFIFAGSSQVSLGPETEVSIQELDASRGVHTVVLEQKSGESSHRVESSASSKTSYTVHTPTGSLLAQGTRFSISIEQNLGTRVTVEEGSVSVEGNGETVLVNEGQVSMVSEGEPPSTPAMRISGEGAVSQIGESWIIAGQSFSIQEDTQIIGDPQVGDVVHVEGRLLADDTRVADLIYLLQLSPANHFALTGEVQSTGEEAWEIDGQTVLITTTTRIEPGIETGDTVRAEGTILENGGLQATTIGLYDQQAGLPFEFTGVVVNTGASIWTISGVPVSVDKDTVIAEGLGVGDIVWVSGRIQSGGAWVATEILPARQGIHTFEMSGRLESLDPWRVAGISFETREWTEIPPGLKAGDNLRVEGVIQQDGTWVAYEISRVEEAPYPLLVIVGTVISVDPWVVSGIPLDVTDDTVIEGDISPGVLVRVEIYLLPDGTWQVIRITSLDVFIGIPGCMDLTATVVSVEGNIIKLLGWPKLEMDEDFRVEGDLRPNSIVLVQLCFDEEGHLTIILITLIFQPDEEPGEEGEPPTVRDKVTICHKPFKKKGGNTITVARPALPAHLGHGDYIGACSR